MVIGALGALGLHVHIQILHTDADPATALHHITEVLDVLVYPFNILPQFVGSTLDATQILVQELCLISIRIVLL